MRHIPLLVLLSLGTAGCNEASRSTTSVAPKDQTTTGAVDRDNTAVNERDREDSLKTPLDQNENKVDIDITANIRKRVVDSKLSVNAQNVKIITQDGHVTLRGPVKTAEEKKQIEDIAHDVAGADKVASQLEIEQNP